MVAAAVADRDGWWRGGGPVGANKKSLPHPKASINTINITTPWCLRHLQQVVLPVAEARPAADQPGGGFSGGYYKVRTPEQFDSNPGGPPGGGGGPDLGRQLRGLRREPKLKADAEATASAVRKR